jgi:hypothetical protein
MNDLREAAEMALAKLDHLWEIAVDERMGTDVLPEIQALRHALAESDNDLKEAIKKGTKAWAGIDPTKWVDELRGGEEQEPVAPVDGVNISAERVDETAKCKHEPVQNMKTYEIVCPHCNKPHDWTYLKGEWVGLDGEIPGLGLVTEEFYNGMLFAEDVLRERNGG